MAAEAREGNAGSATVFVAVGKVVNFSFTQGAKAGGFVISADLALGCLPQVTAALSAPSCCLQSGEFG